MGIKLTIGDNLRRDPATIIDGSKRIKDLIKDSGRDLNVGYWMLDGAALSTQEMNTPLEQVLNGSDTAVLLQVVKANNAA